MPRILDFFDGQSSASAPVASIAEASKFGVFASDAAFEANKGSAGADGDVYLNSTSGVLRRYLTSWGDVREKTNSTAANPTVSNDNTEGYAVFSLWHNSSTNDVFIAVDVSTGAAVWDELILDSEYSVHDHDGTNSPKVLGTDIDSTGGTSGQALTADGVGGSSWTTIAGGGGGGLDVYFTEDVEDLSDTSSFSTGNNATFLGGGTLQGTLAINTGSLISGTNAIRYTQASGSLNDFVASEVITIDNKEKGNDTSVTLYFTYDGNDDDIKFVFWDVTNSQDLTPSTALFKSASNPKRFSVQAFIPAGVASVRWGFQVKVENIGQILDIDDVELSTDPFAASQLVDIQSLQHVFDHSALQDRAGEIRFAAGLDTDDFVGDLILQVEDDAASTRTKFTAVRDCTVDVSVTMFFNSDGEIPQIYKNGTIVMLGSESDANDSQLTTTHLRLDAGDFVTVGSNTTVSASAVNGYLNIVAKAESQNVITPAKSSLTEWAQYTPTIQGLGTPTNVNFYWRQVGGSVEVYGTLTAGTPTAVELQIGLPPDPATGSAMTVNSNVFSAISKVGAFSRNVVAGNSFDLLATANDAFLNGASEANGMLAVQNANAIIGTGENVVFQAFVPVNELDAKANFLAAVPVAKVAVLTNTVSSGTSVAGAAAGSYATRTLNTISGDTTIVSLSSNQFTLGAGKYKIDFVGTVFRVNSNKSKIRNITDSTDDIIGTAEFSDTASSGNSSHGTGEISLTSTKTYELQTRVAVLNGTDGFGRAATFGDSEVYNPVIITKYE